MRQKLEGDYEDQHHLGERPQIAFAVSWDQSPSQCVVASPSDFCPDAEADKPSSKLRVSAFASKKDTAIKHKLNRKEPSDRERERAPA